MIRYLLNTNVVSEPARPHPSARVLQHIAEHEGEMAIPSVVWHELIFGLERLPVGARRTYLDGYLRTVVRATLPIFPYDAAAAHWHGTERARLQALGRTRPFVDGMVAAVAATRNLILVTRNTADFADFDGLRLEDWFEGDVS